MGTLFIDNTGAAHDVVQRFFLSEGAHDETDIKNELRYDICESASEGLADGYPSAILIDDLKAEQCFSQCPLHL